MAPDLSSSWYRPIRQFYVACQVSYFDAKLTLVFLLLRFNIEWLSLIFTCTIYSQKIKLMFESVFAPYFGQLSLSVKPLMVSKGIMIIACNCVECLGLEGISDVSQAFLEGI